MSFLLLGAGCMPRRCAATETIAKSFFKKLSNYYDQNLSILNPNLSFNAAKMYNQCPLLNYVIHILIKVLHKIDRNPDPLQNSTRNQIQRVKQNSPLFFLITTKSLVHIQNLRPSFQFPLKNSMFWIEDTLIKGTFKIWPSSGKSKLNFLLSNSTCNLFSMFK